MSQPAQRATEPAPPAPDEPIVWRWKAVEEAIATRRVRAVRRRGIVLGVLFAAVAFILLRVGLLVPAIVAALAAAVSCTFSALAPGRPLLALTGRLRPAGRLVATLLSWIVLLPIFYAVVVPLAVLTRRRPAPDGGATWRARKGAGCDARQY